VSRDWLLRRHRSGRFIDTLAVESSDHGYLFSIDIDGTWGQEPRSKQANPTSVALSHVIEHLERLAETHGLLQYKLLEHRANCLLGQPTDLADHVHLVRASVHVTAGSQDLADIAAIERRRSEAARADEAIRSRVQRLMVFRDCLREDPTIALAQMLLETPAALTPATLSLLDEVGSRVAAYAPGRETVEVVRLLRDFTANLQPGEKKFIVERLFDVLIEFGGRPTAEKIRSRINFLDGEASVVS